MLRQLESSVGLGWAIRAVTLVIGVLLFSANLVLRPRGPAAVKRAPRSLIDVDVIKDVPFCVFTIGVGFVFLGMYTPFIYIQSYAMRTRITDSDLGFYILAILNSSSIVGRIIPSLIANKVGSMNMFMITITVLTITAYSLIVSHTLARLMVAAVIYGFFAGTFFACMPTIAIRLIGDPKVTGTRMGMAFAVLSFPCLFGAPISGVILDATGTFDDVWIWSGTMLLVGGSIYSVARVLKGGFTLKGAF